MSSTGEALRHAEAAESVAEARRHAALPVAHHEAEAARLVYKAAHAATVSVGDSSATLALPPEAPLAYPRATLRGSS